MPAENDALFDDWSKGSNIKPYFEEMPLELTNPDEFGGLNQPVDPNVPVEQTPPTPEPPEENIPVVEELEGGGTLTIEKTNKGWKAVLDSGEEGVPSENFYGNTQKQLMISLAKGKANATRVVRRMKKKSLLGDDDAPVSVPTVTPVIPKEAATNPLTADDIYLIKNKLAEDPSGALDEYFQKRFGLSAEEVASRLNSAVKSEQFLDQNRVQSAVLSINNEFLNDNQDWRENYQSQDNIYLLVKRLHKLHLRKQLPKDANIDDSIYELYRAGYWTVENLETAKEELIEGGLLKRISTPAAPPKPQPKQEATPAGSQAEPSTTPIATRPSAKSATPVFGIPASSSAPAPAEPKQTDIDLYNIPLEQLRQIGISQLKQMRAA